MDHRQVHEGSSRIEAAFRKYFHRSAYKVQKLPEPEEEKKDQGDAAVVANVPTKTTSGEEKKNEEEGKEEKKKKKSKKEDKEEEHEFTVFGNIKRKKATLF